MKLAAEIGIEWDKRFKKNHTYFNFVTERNCFKLGIQGMQSCRKRPMIKFGLIWIDKSFKNRKI